MNPQTYSSVDQIVKRAQEFACDGRRIGILGVQVGMQGERDVATGPAHSLRADGGGGLTQEVSPVGGAIGEAPVHRVKPLLSGYKLMLGSLSPLTHFLPGSLGLF